MCARKGTQRPSKYATSWHPRINLAAFTVTGHAAELAVPSSLDRLARLVDGARTRMFQADRDQKPETRDQRGTRSSRNLVSRRTERIIVRKKKEKNKKKLPSSLFFLDQTATFPETGRKAWGCS